MFDTDTTALLRAVLEEVCGSISQAGRFQGVVRGLRRAEVSVGGTSVLSGDLSKVCTGKRSCTNLMPLHRLRS